MLPVPVQESSKNRAPCKGKKKNKACVADLRISRAAALSRIAVPAHGDAGNKGCLTLLPDAVTTAHTVSRMFEREFGQSLCALLTAQAQKTAPDTRAAGSAESCTAQSVCATPRASPCAMSTVYR